MSAADFELRGCTVLLRLDRDSKPANGERVARILEFTVT